MPILAIAFNGSGHCLDLAGYHHHKIFRRIPIFQQLHPSISKILLTELWLIQSPARKKCAFLLDTASFFSSKNYRPESRSKANFFIRKSIQLIRTKIVIFYIFARILANVRHAWKVVQRLLLTERLLRFWVKPNRQMRWILLTVYDTWSINKNCIPKFSLTHITFTVMILERNKGVELMYKASKIYNNM